MPEHAFEYPRNAFSRVRLSHPCLSSALRRALEMGNIASVKSSLFGQVFLCYTVEVTLPCDARARIEFCNVIHFLDFWGGSLSTDLFFVTLGNQSRPSSEDTWKDRKRAMTMVRIGAGGPGVGSNRENVVETFKASI